MVFEIPANEKESGSTEYPKLLMMGSQVQS